ncbi:MAG: hypothetical protein ACI8XO_000736 [Verrucomicrobiales bacterium]|jgi:hypothetical protein
MKLSNTLLLTLTLTCALSAPASAADLNKSAAQIDVLIEKNHAPNDVEPNPITSDGTFVRRAYLDITGRIPTADETRAFLGSMEPGKRADLIDQLLDSDGYVSHQFNYWADILRVSSRMNGQGPQNGAAYIKWVKDSIRENMPYDKFVTELITAEGMVDENGAAGFYLRDRGMPLDHLATTVQVFLGTQMVCAQCHDHPFDEWTQMNYFELAAFSQPMDVVRNPPSVTKTITMVNKEVSEKRMAIQRQRNEDKRNKKKRDGKKDDKAYRQLSNDARATTRALSQISYNFRNSVIGETKKTLKLPHDYQYNDAEPGDIISPLTPFGDKITVAEGESRIQAYAKWMTATTNPRFTKTIANRLWKRVMGIGLIEPVDNIREDTEASNPELMAYLEKLLISLDYDLKAYYRVLYNTRTYQREAQSADLLTKYYYPGPRLRRMSAEQIWDSLITLVRPETDTATDPRSQSYAQNDTRIKAWKRLDSQSPIALLKRQKELAEFTKNADTRLDQMRTEIEKAISSKNAKRAEALGQQVVKFNQEATIEYARLTYWDLDSFKNNYFQTPYRNVPRTLFRQLKTAFPKAKFPDDRKAFQIVASNSMMMSGGNAKDKKKNQMREEMARLKKQLGKEEFKKLERQRSAIQRLKGGSYVRASELSSPAPDGHFLRTFGQSDRQLIENADDQASVPQSLALMNGPLFGAIADPFSVISMDASKAADRNEVIDSIYLSMLARKATDKERSLLSTEFDHSQHRSEAIRSVIWAVLNTQQFIFIE